MGFSRPGWRPEGLGPMRRRVLLVGATGAFGRRLAERLAAWPDLELVLAARGEGALEALREALSGSAAQLEIACFDRRSPQEIARLAPWAVVDAAGPFQGSDFVLARAAIAAGAHYVDLADARDFVAGFPSALDAEAKAAGVTALTGASSTPALSNAALDRLTDGWRAVDRVTIAISPGARAPRGLSVVRAILSYAGRPVRVFRGGRWTQARGWGLTRRLDFEPLGRRWVGLCETPDLDIVPARKAVREEALFLAGLEQPLLHAGLWLLAWPVRLGLVPSLTGLARPLRWAAGLLAPLGSDRGGMLVSAQGVDAAGAPVRASWRLWAE
ncbi:MAG: saccharopine dehydrogenase NADP-binding domain-containing protein, partial [Phenylobacterium sp.]